MHARTHIQCVHVAGEFEAEVDLTKLLARAEADEAAERSLM